MSELTITFLNELIVTIVIPAITALLAFLGKKLVAFIDKKGEELETRTKNDKAKTYIDLATSTVTDVVEALNQTVVGSIKAASEDGKLTKEDAENIKTMAIDTTKKLLNSEAKDAIATVIDDLDEFIAVLVEAAVAKSKK